MCQNKCHCTKVRTVGADPELGSCIQEADYLPRNGRNNMKMRNKGFKASTTASQIILAHSLNALYLRHRKEFSGVWMCDAARDLPRIADVLLEYANEGVNPHMTVYWQPPLFPDELETPQTGTCEWCGKERELNTNGRCAECEAPWNR